MSALPPKADIDGRRGHVRLVPKGDIRIAAEARLFAHLVGGRAVVSGTVRLSALAVERRTHCDLGAIIAGAGQSFGRISTTNRRSGTFVLFCAVCARFPVSKKYSPAL